MPRWVKKEAHRPHLVLRRRTCQYMRRELLGDGVQTYGGGAPAPNYDV